eukprot:1953566-Prymnesium_polylepis.1
MAGRRARKARKARRVTTTTTTTRAAAATLVGVARAVAATAGGQAGLVGCVCQARAAATRQGRCWPWRRLQVAMARSELRCAARAAFFLPPFRALVPPRCCLRPATSRAPPHRVLRPPLPHRALLPPLRPAPLLRAPSPTLTAPPNARRSRHPPRPVHRTPPSQGLLEVTAVPLEQLLAALTSPLWKGVSALMAFGEVPSLWSDFTRVEYHRERLADCLIA